MHIKEDTWEKLHMAKQTKTIFNLHLNQFNILTNRCGRNK